VSVKRLREIPQDPIDRLSRSSEHRPAWQGLLLAGVGLAFVAGGALAVHQLGPNQWWIDKKTNRSISEPDLVYELSRDGIYVQKQQPIPPEDTGTQPEVRISSQPTTPPAGIPEKTPEKCDT
jgi:hypothetical protein